MNSYAAGPRFNLSDPPRWVPLSVRLRLWFGGLLNQFGWLLIGIGALLCGLVHVPQQIQSLIALRGKLSTAEANVTKAEDTRVKIGKREVWKYTFEFHTANQKYEASSYETGSSLAVGSSVMAEFPADRPELARIRGMRATMFGWGALFLLMLPVVGISFITFGGRAGRRAARLLAQGHATTGRLISRRPTGTRINEKIVYQLTFEFQADAGMTFEVSANTHETGTLTDDQEEPLLYNPHRPIDATLLDHLPGAPQVGEFGEIQVSQPLKGWLCLILPIMVCAGIAAYVGAHL